MGMHVSSEEILKLDCPRCGAKSNEPCTRKDTEKADAKARAHKERVTAARARKVPAKARV